MKRCYRDFLIMPKWMKTIGTAVIAGLVLKFIMDRFASTSSGSGGAIGGTNSNWSDPVDWQNWEIGSDWDFG